MKRRMLSALLALLMVLTLLPTAAIAEETQQADTRAHTHNYNYGTTLVFPTCEEQGYTIYECECGDWYEEILPATGAGDEEDFEEGSEEDEENP